MTVGHVDAAALLEEWEALRAVAPGDRFFRTRRLTRPTRIDLRAALREIDAAPCLVAVAAEDSEQVATFETSGFRLSHSNDQAGALLVLSLEEPSRRDLFAEICSDVLRSVVRSEEEGEEDLLRELSGRLAAWRSFLRDQGGGLARHEVVGLIGELLILDRLLDRSPDALTLWKSPDNGLHDFAQHGNALEVKTSLGGARRLHISTLDQLDAAGLASLYLAHVRLIERADGESIVDIANRIEQRFGTDRDRREFRNALLRRGLAPGADEPDPRVGCLGMEAYIVRTGFPCLTRTDVPLGVAEAVYDVEVRSLTGFLADADAAFDLVGSRSDV